MRLLHDRVLRRAALCGLGYALVSLPVVLLTRSVVHAMMVWNVFLAFVPLVFARLAVGCAEHARIRPLLFSALWLLFFPNAPYMVTDLIHIRSASFYAPAPGGSTAYAADPVVWLRLLHIGAGVLLGTLLGLLSLNAMHRLSAQRRGKAAANAGLIAVSLLAGFAVYLGRFLRLNSWDVLRPAGLVLKITAEFSPFALTATLLYAAYILFTYALFGLLAAGRTD